MRTISLKIPDALDKELDTMAKQRNVTRSEVLREAISSLSKQRERSAADLAGELVGSLRGATDLSTDAKHMRGYGE